jgi:hypothetical protein
LPWKIRTNNIKFCHKYRWMLLDPGIEMMVKWYLQNIISLQIHC